MGEITIDKTHTNSKHLRKHMRFPSGDSLQKPLLSHVSSCQQTMHLHHHKQFSTKHVRMSSENSSHLEIQTRHGLLSSLDISHQRTKSNLDL